MTIARKYSHFTPAEITALFAHANRIEKSPFWDILQASAKHEHGRIAVITKRALGTAPTRNRIRRQIKTLYFDLDAYTKPYDIMVIVKKEALNLSYQELKEKLTPIFKGEKT